MTAFSYPDRENTSIEEVREAMREEIASPKKEGPFVTILTARQAKKVIKELGYLPIEFRVCSAMTGTCRVNECYLSGPPCVLSCDDCGAKYQSDERECPNCALRTCMQIPCRKVAQ